MGTINKAAQPFFIVSSNDPAADPQVERVARIFCADQRMDPDGLDADGDPLWRGFVERAVSSIEAWKLMRRDRAPAAADGG